MTTRIESEMQDGRKSFGTGFFWKFCESGSTHVLAICTNKHVIQGAKSITIVLSMQDQNGNILLGDLEKVTLSVNDAPAIFHQDPKVDLACILIAPFLKRFEGKSKKPVLICLDSTMIADQAFYESLGIFEQILMVGYPIGLWDSKNNSPLMRRGITATHPKLKFEGEPHFIIDCACFPGSSGSPVFIADFGFYVDKDLNAQVGNSRVKLIGVLWGGPQFNAQGEVKSVPVPTSTGTQTHTMIPSNLGFCIHTDQLKWFETELNKVLTGQ